MLSKSNKLFGIDKKSGIQKYHVKPTTRMGGLGVAISISSGIYLTNEYHPAEAYLAFFMMLSFIPIFTGGFLEDLTHKVSAKSRLWLAFFSSIIIVLVTQIEITRTDISLIDNLFKIPGFSLVITLFLIVGFLNAINIIDGFHGVAAGAILIMLITIATIAFIVDDYLIFRISLIIITANIGFLFWNWPNGHIFLGDSGSYLFGIWLVVLGIMLIYRTQLISPLATLLICIYPIIETLFTIYRRTIKRSKAFSQPDALHLHSLIYRRLIHTPSLFITLSDKNKDNSKVALYIWVYILVNAITAVIFYKNTYILFIIIILSIFLYIKFYQAIINFKTPKFLIQRKNNFLNRKNN